MSESFAVVGGEGFVGHALVLALRAKYPHSTVVSLDLVQRNFPEKTEWSFTTCDLTVLDSLTSAFRQYGVTTVFHTASPFLGSGKDICEKVNIAGTKTVLQACRDTGVIKLVYTSSAGIVFDGRSIINVDERCTPTDRPADAYNDTKARAEAIILEANGQDGLLTCAIRPAGIFGPGDRQNIPAWLNVLKAGKTAFQMGGNTNLFDITYIDNVVHAHLLAAERLGTTVPVSVFANCLKPVGVGLPRRPLPTSASTPLSKDDRLNDIQGQLDPPLPAMRNRYDQWFNLQVEASRDQVDEIPVAGQAYYITNGQAVGFWSWGTSIWHAYNGFDKRMIYMPPSVGLIYASIGDFICRLLGTHFSTPKVAVQYAIVPRYYNIEKARRMLGYEPIVGIDEGLRLSMAWYKANEASIIAPVYGQKKP